MELIISHLPDIIKTSIYEIDLTGLTVLVYALREANNSFESNYSWNGSSNQVVKG